MHRRLFDDTHEFFRQGFRLFVEKELAPFVDDWERAGIVDKSMFRAAAKAGFLGLDVPEEYGGGGNPDFRYNVVMNEEFARAGVASAAGALTMQNDVCMPYFLTEANAEQKSAWLPKLTSGEWMAAVAMSEPGGGSDLAAVKTTAVRDGDHYLLNGAKTFISNGINCDVVIVVCKTDPSAGHRGITLLLVEDGMDGFARGRKLDKIGLRSQDTAELFFDNVRVPVANRFGEEGDGFKQLMRKLPQERLHLSVVALAQAEVAFEQTLAYIKERHAFGQPIGSFQANRFTMAELRTELDLGRRYIDAQVEDLNAGELTAEDAAKGKWWCTELQWRVLDSCLQLHGGYGYMEEYPIARTWRDGRVLRIVGGTNQIMKEIVGRSLGL